MQPDPQPTLAIRPRPASGESTLGYLKRVANANGFGSVGQLFSSLRARQQGAFDELCARLRLSNGERAGLFGSLPAQWDHQDIPLGLDHADFNSTHGRWCHLCLREGCVLSGQWTLKLVCTCPKHGTWLKESCSRCGANLSWSEVVQSEGRCPCGASLMGDDIEEANEDVRALTLLLCGDSSGMGRLTCLSGLSTPAIHRLVRYLGPFQATTRPSHPGQTLDVHRLDVAKGLVVGAASLLTQWPTHLHKKIAELQADAPGSPSVRRTFDPLYRVLYEALPEAEFQFLRDAFEDYLHANWWGLICKRNKRMRPETTSGHPRLSLPQMAKAAQVPPSVVRHMVQAELVPANAAQLMSGRRARSIHLSELQRIQCATQGALSLEKAARALSLPERRVRELILSGHMSPLVSRQVTKGAAAWLIPRGKIDRLHVQTNPAPGNTQCVSVRDILKYWRLREHEGSALIAAVADGQLHAEGDGLSLVPVGEAMLCTASAKEWLLKHRSEARQDFSVDAAAKALGIKQQVAYDLVRLGVLRSTHAGALGQRVSVRDIERFKATYVSLACLASETRRSPRALLAELAASPVCGPTINGARQYFYRRAELELRSVREVSATC
jgi:hypothetical protein